MVWFSSVTEKTCNDKKCVPKNHQVSNKVDICFSLVDQNENFCFLPGKLYTRKRFFFFFFHQEDTSNATVIKEKVLRKTSLSLTTKFFKRDKIVYLMESTKFY